jgi:hypothetical protein
MTRIECDQADLLRSLRHYRRAHDRYCESFFHWLAERLDCHKKAQKDTKKEESDRSKITHAAAFCPGVVELSALTNRLASLLLRRRIPHAFPMKAKDDAIGPAD